MPASQAGRRRFDPGLPLQLFYNLADSTSYRFTSFTSKTRFACRIGTRSPLCRLAVGQSKLKLGNRFQSAFKIALCVRVNRDPDRVPSLIGGHLRVNALLVAKTRLGPAQPHAYPCRWRFKACDGPCGCAGERGDELDPRLAWDQQTDDANPECHLRGAEDRIIG